MCGCKWYLWFICGIDSNMPQEEFCKQDPNVAGQFMIPDKYLFSESCDDDDESCDDDGGTVYSPQFLEKSDPLFDAFHVMFLTFMTVTVVSMWISFLPGIGRDKSKPPPSLANLEEHINNPSPHESECSKSLVCVAFSISASEPRMMVLRNLVGKLMAWCNDQKIFLKRRPWDERGSNASLTGKVALSTCSRRRQSCRLLCALGQLHGFGEHIRPRFIEGLAEQMENMTAESDSLNLSREPTTEKIGLMISAPHVVKTSSMRLRWVSIQKTRLALKITNFRERHYVYAICWTDTWRRQSTARTWARRTRSLIPWEIDTVLDGIGVKDPQVLYLVRTFMKEIRDKIIMHKQNQESCEYTKDDLLDSKLEKLANLCHAKKRKGSEKEIKTTQISVENIYAGGAWSRRFWIIQLKVKENQRNRERALSTPNTI